MKTNSRLKYLSSSAAILSAITIGSLVFAQDVSTEKSMVDNAETKSGEGIDVNVPKTTLDNAISANKNDVVIKQGETKDLGIFLTSDVEAIANARKVAEDAYKAQAAEIKKAGDQYRADLKYWTDNKTKVEALVSDLNVTVKKANELGVIITKEDTVNGKSFEEIQSALAAQIKALDEAAAKQKENNAEYIAAKNTYDANKAEIEKLEAQLRELAQKGKDLGATIAGTTVTDSKTVEEIKALLQQQVDTMNKLIIEQQKVNDNYKAAEEAYKQQVAAINAKVAELNKAVNDAKAAGVTIAAPKNDATKATTQDIITALNNDLANVNAAKAKKDAQNASNADALAKYQAEKAKVDAENAKLKADYDAKMATYTQQKTAYDAALIKYNSDLVAYNTALANYNAKIAEANQAVGINGNLSKVASQNLIFEQEKNATVTFSGQYDPYDGESSVNGSIVDPGLGFLDSNWQSISRYKPSAGDQPSLNKLIGGALSSSYQDTYFLVAQKDAPFQVTYENLQNSSYAGRKIAKAVFTYTVKETPANDGTIRFAIFRDPTVTAYTGATNDSNSSTAVDLSVKFFYEDGSPVVFNSDTTALISAASMNATAKYGEKEFTKINNTTSEFIKITGSSVDLHGDEIYSMNDNDKTSEGSLYNRDEWDKKKLDTFYYGAGAILIKDGASEIKTGFGTILDDSFLTANSFRPTIRQWWTFNSDLAVKDYPKNKPIAPTKQVAPTQPTAPNYLEVPTYNPVTTPVTASYSTYTVPVLPAKVNVTGSFSTYTVPHGPVRAFEDGTYNEFTIPEAPTKPEFTYTLYDFSTLLVGTKSVKNSEGTDINNQLVNTTATGGYELTLTELPANREELESLIVNDELPKGFKYNQDETVKANPDYEITFDGATNTMVAKSKVIAEINKDRTKGITPSGIKIIGTFENPATTYENVYYVTVVSKDTKDKPTSSTYTNKVVNKTPEDPNPTKAVKTVDGQDINENKVVAGQQIVYDMTWDLDQYKGIVVDAKTIATGFFFGDDFDETNLTTTDKDITITKSSDGSVVDGIEVKVYASEKDVPADVLKQMKDSGFEPKGGFFYVAPKDTKVFYETFVKNGENLNISAKMSVKTDAKGVVANTAYQNGFGKGVNTNTVNNNIVKPTPVKAVKHVNGTDINGNNVKSGQVINYVLEWDMSEYGGIGASEASIVDGFYYMDDIDENAVDALVDLAKLTDKDGNIVDDVKFTVYNSIDEAPEKVKNQLKDTKVNGKFIFANIGDDKAFFEKYVKTGTDLFVTLPVQVKSSTVGVFENIAHQGDFAGEGTVPNNPTNKVENNVPTQNTKKFFVNAESVDGTVAGTKNAVTKGIIKNKETKYSWLIEHTLDKYSVEKGLYTYLSLNDLAFNDAQTITGLKVYDSKNTNVTNLVDVQVLVDGKIYSVNGEVYKEKTESNTVTVADNVVVGKTEVEADTTKASGVQASDVVKENNILLPVGLNTDGKQGAVEIKVVFKDPKSITDTKYYVALNGISLAEASAEELTNYTSEDGSITIENAANLEADFNNGNDKSSTDKSKVEVRVTPKEKETPKPAPVQTYANTGVDSKATIFGVIAIAFVGILGFMFKDKFKKKS